MTEVLAPGVTIKHDGSPFWKSLPTNLTFCGADIRAKSKTAEQYIEAHGLFLQGAAFGGITKERWRRILSTIPELLNQELRQQSEPSADRKSTKKSKGMKGAKNGNALGKPTAVTVCEAAFQTMKKIWSSRYEISPQFKDLTKNLERVNDVLTDPLLLLSNQGFADELAKVKASGAFSEFIAIWGLSHFTDDHFFQRLDPDHVVLMPSEKREREAIDESDWRLLNFKKGMLSVTCRKKELELEIPEEFYSLFNPTHQALIKKKEAKKRIV